MAQSHSTKDRDKDKGFRGIGRLGGLGYCNSLSFETSYLNEDIKSIMVWNAKELKRIINDRSLKLEAAEVISNITTYHQKKEDPDVHYFKVILENVTNDELLDKNNIENYLSMVAPVPFHSKFIFKKLIYDELKRENLRLDEYCIFLNTDQLFKAYSSYLYESINGNKRKFDEIFDIAYMKFHTKDNELLAWGWYGISSFVKQIPTKINNARGLRIRKGNIQIGGSYTLVRFHKEQRGNYYFFGEIYAYNKYLIPNARRDYFIENQYLSQLEKGMKSFLHEKLHRLYYDASNIRSAVRKVEKLIETKEEFDNRKNNGFISKEEKKEIEDKLIKSKTEAEKAKKELGKYKKKGESNLSLKKIYDKVVSEKKIEQSDLSIDGDIYEEQDRTKFRTDKLSKLDKQQRKLLSKVFEIIRENIEPELSENLIIKIEENFK